MSPSAKASGSYLDKVDAYIGKSAEFAQPILWHLRELMHKAVPDIEETIKWSMPFFMYKGLILGNMAAFKQHVSIGFWGEELAAKLKAEGTSSGEAMGSLGRITSLKDLPSDKVLAGYIKLAAKVIDDGSRTKNFSRTPRKAAKPDLVIPEELSVALKKNKAAQKTFDNFAPSCRKEYVDWVADAKREETRNKRVAQAIEWMAEGKRRHWKYENC